MNEKYFHLTLGPVQGFVAQARRSRDYWAGSFILSWLSGVAILSVMQHKGKISFPEPDERFLQAMDASRNKPEKNPLQGGIPNRFKTKELIAPVPENFSGKMIVRDIWQAWQALADLVWDHDIGPFLANHPQYDQDDIAAIWTRQINAVWDISWVMTQDALQTNLLDRRKNWRTHYFPEEYGSKCMMMGSLQELSGTVNPSRSESKGFWSELRDYLGATDLNEGEQLSAPGLIKRRFAHHFNKLKITLHSGLQLRGWSFKPKTNNNNTPLHVPSLPYLAATPWLREVLQISGKNKEVKDALDHMITASEDAFRGRSSDNVSLHCFKDEWHPVTKLDGMTFFPHMLTSELNYRRNDADRRADKRELEHTFSRLMKETKLPAPSPFYALLMMDGDSLGAQMSDPDKQKGISQALNQFTRKVQNIVHEQNGFLIYAGGDDVLALFPMEYALPCAIEIRQTYIDLFKHGPAVSTISAAIQYAHIKSPLMKIIADSHHLLDKIAKEKTGRDGLAIRVNKPGGIHCQWHMPWEVFLPEQPLLRVTELLSENTEHRVTNGWLTQVYQLLLRLMNKDNQLEIDQKSFQKLVRQAYLHSASVKSLPQQIELAVDYLMKACQTVTRTADLNLQNVSYQPSSAFQSDAIKLIRFLASKGV